MDQKIERQTLLSRVGLALADWTERWFPDPLVFAFIGVVVVFLIGLAAGESPGKMAIQGGKSFWALIPFTMQMVMIIVGGYVVASSAPVGKVIDKIAGIPKTPRTAVATVALFAMLTGLISWGLSLIFGGLLVRRMAYRIPGLDYRAAGAAGYLGNGVVWALGLSSSAAMFMATKTSIPPALFNITGLIPLTQTIFTWQSMVMAVVLICGALLIAFRSVPPPERAKTAQDFHLPPDKEVVMEARSKPGEWLEYSPVLTLLVAAVLIVYLIEVFRTSPQGALAALDLNTYNLIFITAGLLLHWRPKRFMRAVTECIPATGGVIIQFPFYAMIFGMITNTGLSAKAAHLFASVTTHQTYALLVAAYSALLGLFIPSGGSKWIVEAPYVMQAAITNHVHLGWVVQIYNAAEALPGMINPFFMLPLLGILKIRARDLVGFTALYLVVQVPVVFFLCWLFSQTIPFVAPVK